MIRGFWHAAGRVHQGGRPSPSRKARRRGRAPQSELCRPRCRCPDRLVRSSPPAESGETIVWHSLWRRRGRRSSPRLPSSSPARSSSPVNSAHDAKELTRVLRDHRVRGLITGTRLAAKAASAISSTPAVEVIVLAGAGNVRTAPGCFGFEDAIVGLSHHALAHDGTDLDDAIVLRSAQAVGGTAEATVGHRAAVAATEAIAQSFVDDGSEGVTSAAPLSAEHGLYQMFAAMKLGATFVLERTLVISAADGGGARSSIRRHSQPPPCTATTIATDSDSGPKGRDPPCRAWVRRSFAQNSRPSTTPAAIASPSRSFPASARSSPSITCARRATTPSSRTARSKSPRASSTNVIGRPVARWPRPRHASTRRRRRLQEADFARRFVVLTFDDGYRDYRRLRMADPQAAWRPGDAFRAVELRRRAWRPLVGRTRAGDRGSVRRSRSFSTATARRFDTATAARKAEAFAEHLLVAPRPARRGRAPSRLPRTRARRRDRRRRDLRRIVHGLARARRDSPAIRSSPSAPTPTPTSCSAKWSDGRAPARKWRRGQAHRGSGSASDPAHFSFPVGDPTAAGPREFAIAAELGFRTAVTTRPGVLFPDHREHLDRAAAHLGQRRFPADALSRRAALRRADGPDEPLPPRRRRLSSIAALRSCGR